MAWVRVSDDARGFITDSGRPFTPWGFNYDHDEAGRLIEDYWTAEWGKVVEDFREMKALGANVVRIHLQVGRFIEAPDRPNAAALDRLGKLLRLAEETGLYLDLTGLGCYHKEDVPAWYDPLDEEGRWSVQERFWEAVARRCTSSPAVFCYDLMNEPLVPGPRPPRDGWLGGNPLGNKYFVQYVTLQLGDRKREEVARAWTKRLVAAIRRHDRRHLVTVGLVHWSLPRPRRLYSGFDPARVAPEVDFVSVHLYPKTGEFDEAMETLRGFAHGKPVVIEETFPLKCGLPEFNRFLAASREVASGWIGFYWGATPADLRKVKTLPAAITLQWLERFREGPPGSRPPGRATDPGE